MTPSVQYDFRRWLPEQAESPLHYWTSLSPLAPAFGVRWRFEGALPEALPPIADLIAEAAETGKEAFDELMQSAAGFGQGGMSALGETDDDTGEDEDEDEDGEDDVEDEDEDEDDDEDDDLDDDDEIEDAEVVAAAEDGATADQQNDAADGQDDLSLIKGVGPKMVKRLAAQGVLRFADIAGWTTEDVAKFDTLLEGIPGRIERDDWVGQARALAI